ncbi:MAG: DUF6010 family protein [Acidobacteriota bacterium]
MSSGRLVIIVLAVVVGAAAGALYCRWVDRKASRSRSTTPPRRAARGYAVGLFVAALLYALFPLFRGVGAPDILAVEALGLTVFTGFALLGIYRHMGWLVIGWAVHVGWDLLLHGPWSGAEWSALPPPGYALLCLGFDVVVALWILRRWILSPADVVTATA